MIGRMWKIVLYMVILTLILLGCSQNAQQAQQDTTTNDQNSAASEGSEVAEEPETEETGEVIELTVWHYFNPEYDGTAFAEVVEDYNASQNKYHVTQEFIPREELLKQYSIGLVGDVLPDIGMVDNPEHAAFSAMGLFEDITELIEGWEETEHFFEGPLKSTMYEGRYYGLPHNSNCLALWYDEDMLNEAGVKIPETWDELMEAAKALTKDGVYGLAISAVKNEEGVFQFLPWLLSAGADVENLDSPEAVRALTYITEMVQQGYMSNEIINWTQADVQKQFATGKAAMMINGPWNIETTKRDAPDKKWHVAKIPKDVEYSSVLGGENFGIIKGKDIEGGWEFLKYLCGREGSEKFNKATGKFPPRKDILESSDHWKSDPVLAVFGEQMEYAMPRGPHPKWPEISTAISEAMHEAITGVKTPEQALKDAQIKAQEALKE